MTDHITPEDFFPYQTMREGQREMMTSIYEAVSTGKQICAEAPNGFGKTCVALCGVLPWAQENEGKILYCARTHRQLDRVVEELRAINSIDDEVVSGVSFRGRRHMCLNPFVLENAGAMGSISEVCGQLKSARRCAYYERLRKIRTPEELLENMPQKVLTAPDIIDIGRKRQVCPYELAKILTQVVDVVALSYLYVFDPWVMEAFLPELKTPLSKTILVQDEAHNVPTTALDSVSDSLPTSTMRMAMREAQEAHVRDSISERFCRGLSQCIINLSKDLPDGGEQVVKPQGVYDAALLLAGLDDDSEPLDHMISVGWEIRKTLLKAAKFPRSYIHRVAEFMVNWMAKKDRDDYAFLLSSEKRRDRGKKVSLDLVALDPTAVIKPILSKIHSSVAISGTISPLNAYAEMIGFDDDAVLQSFRSPFDVENRLGLIVSDIDTSYKSRNDNLYSRIVSHCVEVAHATPGNTGIFTTSYYIARSLVDAGLERKLARPIFMERAGMKGRQNDDMIEEFKRKGRDNGAVLLGVQGGRNSEGGDFPGSTMESVVVVGVPYARPTPRTDALIDYFDWRFNGKGRDYAYVLPAMTRATQAAGRPVRRMTDRGVIVLLDQRFATPYLKRFMPKWLEEVVDVIPDDPDETSRRISKFFAS